MTKDDELERQLLECERDLLAEREETEQLRARVEYLENLLHCMGQSYEDD